GSSHDWALAAPGAALPSLRSRMYSQLLWTQNMLMPYLWTHLRGRSVGDGREPRRPVLEAVTT
ncbi:lysophospholipase, partial [Mycobacterium sp. ITM-2017-0098]